MMNSYRRNNHGSRRLFVATLLVVFLFLADIVLGGRVHALVRSGASAFSRSVFGIADSVFGSGFFSSRASLEAQNRALTGELSQYEERAAAFAAMEAESEQLRSLTHLAEASRGVTAPVVSSVISSPYGTFLVGAGEADGVSRGALVLTQGGFVVGTVSDAGAHTSTVKEIFAPAASLNALIHGTSVVLSGSGGGNAHTSVPRGVNVAAGDAVVSPELGERPVGIVGSVASSTARATQDVFVRLPVNLGALQFVYVVSP